MLKVLTFGVGYLVGGLVANLLYPRRAIIGPPALVDDLIWFAAVHAAGLAGGCFALGLLHKTRSYDPVHADYDDRPPTDPA
jgi:hypothetical protein